MSPCGSKIGESKTMPSLCSHIWSRMPMSAAAVPVGDADAGKMGDLHAGEGRGTCPGTAASAEKAHLIIAHIAQRAEMSDLEGIGLITVALADVAPGIDRVGKHGEHAGAARFLAAGERYRLIQVHRSIGAGSGRRAHGTSQDDGKIMAQA